MNDSAPIKAFYQGDSYSSPAQPVSWLARTCPSLSFYAKAIGIVWRASVKARNKNYRTADWHDSSLEVIRALEQTGCRLDVQGLDKFRNFEQPCVFIGNHMSTLETFVLPSLITPRVKDMTFVVKRSLTEYPVFKHVMLSRDPVVVDRVNPRDDLKAVMEQGKARLAEGRSIVIFPQHTRSIEFDPQQFNSIGIKLAQKAGVPVVPIALQTSAWAPGSLFKDYGPIDPARPIHFSFGEPFEVSGKGKEEHQRVVDFIQQHLEMWQGDQAHS